MPENSITHRPAKSWHKISATVDSRMTEAVAAYLSNISGTGVEITGFDTGNDAGDPACPNEKIVAYIPIDPSRPDKNTLEENVQNLKLFLAQVSHIFPNCPAPHFSTETIMEEDWGKKWKSFFTSFHITPSLIIKPSWETAAAQNRGGKPRPAVIEMDPGLAFGTGHHASTQLALMLLEELIQNRAGKFPKVLDVGTGSGILAMACGLFGAEEILALDNDPDAVETARQNIMSNKLGDKIVVSGRDIKSLQAGFDIVVANITHDTLTALAEILASLVNPDGFLVLSGILKGSQEQSIHETYTQLGLKLIKKLAQDEWAAMLFLNNG